MGNKVFISYKYADSSVQQFPTTSLFTPSTTVRDYVDRMQSRLERDGVHINKGELDGEDLSHFRDETIQSRLTEKIFDSSVTIVLISPEMRERLKNEKDQWIPWEISYSLRLKRRRFNGDREQRSNRNGILLVCLPDRSGSYEYITQSSGYYGLEYSNFFFQIIKNNLNNLKSSYNYLDLPKSYMIFCTWAQFQSQMNDWILKAGRLRFHADKYNITVQV